jgi:hypothetical protein
MTPPLATPIVEWSNAASRQSLSGLHRSMTGQSAGFSNTETVAPVTFDDIVVSVGSFLSMLYPSSRTGNVHLRETLAKRSSPLSVPRPRNPNPAVSNPLAHAMEASARPRYDIVAAHCDGDPTKKVDLTVRLHHPPGPCY